MSAWDAHDRWLEHDATDAEAASVLEAREEGRRRVAEVVASRREKAAEAAGLGFFAFGGRKQGRDEALREALEKFRPEDKEEEKAG